jgi:hypothetical protein
MPWSNNNYNCYNNYGYQQDNGIFSFNPYDYWDPRWYSEEMSNMMDEFSDNNNGALAFKVNANNAIVKIFFIVISPFSKDLCMNRND